jgi:peptidoglycan hydrolase CwlO-like protein
MDHLWDAATAAFSAALGFVIWMFKKHSDRIDEMDKRLVEVEKTTAIIETKLDGMKEDISEIKDGVSKLQDIFNKY